MHGGKTNHCNESPRCAYCRAELVDDVKLIPECCNSICGRCHDALAGILDESGQYACNKCDQLHVMPTAGLADDQAVLRSLKCALGPQSLLEKVRPLQNLISDADAKLRALRERDEAFMINDYCDSLTSQVDNALCRTFRMLDELGREVKVQIDAYRYQLLAQLPRKSEPSSAASFIRRELDQLSHEIQRLERDWSAAFDWKKVTSLDIETSRDKTNELNLKLKLFEERLAAELLQGRFMRFEEARPVFNAEEAIGKIFFDFAPQEARSSFRQAQSRLLRNHLGSSDFDRQVVFLPNGNYVCCSNENTINIWNSETDEKLLELKPSQQCIQAIALLNDRWLACGSADAFIYVHDLNDGELKRTLRGHSSGVWSLKAFENGNLASCAMDNTIRIWDPYSSERNLLATIPVHEANWFNVLMSPMTEDYLVTCVKKRSADGIKIWNASTGEMVKAVSTRSEDICSLTVLSNNNIAVGSIAGEIEIIDLIDGAKSIVLSGCHDGGVYSLVQSPNGLVLSGGSGNDPSVRAWDLDSGRLVKTISAHRGCVFSLGISRDGKLLASSSFDNLIKIWTPNHSDLNHHQATFVI